MIDLDSSSRANSLKSIIQNKKALSKLYLEFYTSYTSCLERCDAEGLSIEVGSGAGFLQKILPEVITTDIIAYETVDLIMDATRLPFSDNSLKTVFLLNTLHHIPKACDFFSELSRCLKPGGRVLIIDQYHGWFSKYIYKYLHHEPYHPEFENWDFKTTGPLSGANGALCWIIFCRDRSVFEDLFPSLEIVNILPHTPLRYWLSGGLKSWYLLPGSFFGFATKIDQWLSKYLPGSSSFIEVEIKKTM